MDYLEKAALDEIIQRRLKPFNFKKDILPSFQEKQAVFAEQKAVMFTKQVDENKDATSQVCQVIYGRYEVPMKPSFLEEASDVQHQDDLQLESDSVSASSDDDICSHEAGKPASKGAENVDIYSPQTSYVPYSIHSG